LDINLTAVMLCPYENLQQGQSIPVNKLSFGYWFNCGHALPLRMAMWRWQIATFSGFWQWVTTDYGDG